MKNKYFVEDRNGEYSIGVNTLEELILVTTGEYSNLDGIGYPSILGDWFESNSDMYPWSLDYLKEGKAKGYLEGFSDYKLPKMWDSEGDDVSHLVKQYIEREVLPYLKDVAEEEAAWADD